METVFSRILNMNLSAAAVICAVVLVRFVLKRAPKKWSYLLWCVVAFRLLCPVSISAPFSILRLTAQPAAVTETAAGTATGISYIPQDIGDMAQPLVYVGTPTVSQRISQELPAPQLGDSANPLQVWIAVGTALWCVGMAALLLYGVISYVNLRRRLKGAVRVTEGVCETDAVRSPFILGLFRPTVYLPAGLAGEPLRYVLAHERFHIRHGDHAVKLLAFLLLCVHWFDPLVWLAFYLMGRDMEMRCDEAVLSAESGITKPYSMALLSFATARRFPSPSPLAFGETGVKQRIKNALRWKKPKAWVTVLAAALCVAAVAACAVNPGREEKTSAPTGTPWDWTSTVQLSDIKILEGDGIPMRYAQMKELVELLNAVQPEEVVRGRGIPSNKTLDITTGVGYRLRWAGGTIELDFDDAAAAAALYGGAEEPGVWEIHNEALYAFLEGLAETDAETPQESWRDAFLDFFNNTLLSDAAKGDQLCGIALMDLDFDTMPELAVWRGDAFAVTSGAIYRIDGTQVIKASELDYSTNILSPLETTRAFWLVRDRTSGNTCWALHSANGKEEHNWGSYVLLDGKNTEIAAYDATGVVPIKAAMNEAWETFSARYEVLDIDYSDFTLSIYDNGILDAKHFAGILDRWQPLRVFTETAASDVVDWGAGFSPDGHLYVSRYYGDGWSIYIPVSGWTLAEAADNLTKWVSDAGTGSTLVVRRMTREEAAAEQPKLLDWQIQRIQSADDGTFWLAFGQYDPMLMANSSWAGTEPELLRHMVMSLRVGQPEIIAGAPSLSAVSGGQSVPLTPMLTMDGSQELQYLPIIFDEYGMPFEIIRNGERIICDYAIYDAETEAPVEFFRPSGLEPQTYLFQNTVPGKRYIIAVDTFSEDPVNGRTYAFGAIAPERKIEPSHAGRPMPAFRDADGRELSLNMSLSDLNAQLGTLLTSGHIYTLPQHALGATAVAFNGIYENGQWESVVMLGFGEGWEISEGPGIGATTEEVRAYWGEPDIAAEPASERTPTINYLAYELDSGTILFDHRGDGVITQIELHSNDPQAQKTELIGSCAYWHGRGETHIENFSCFGELDVRITCDKPDGHYRMRVTDAEGAEALLLEGDGGNQYVIPPPVVQNGTLDVTFDGKGGEWIVIIDWLVSLRE